MSQVIEAKCPKCQNTLRVPLDWVGKTIRCKFCQVTFQAHGKLAGSTSDNKAVVQVAKPNIPIGKPANSAAPVAVAAGAPPVMATNTSFGFDEDPSAETPSVAKPRKKGYGAMTLVATFGVLFLVGAGGAGYFLYKVINTPHGLGSDKHVAKGDGQSTRSDSKPPRAVKADGPARDKGTTTKKDSNKEAPPPAADSGKKEEGKTPTKKVTPFKNPPPFKDIAKKDAPKKGPVFSNDPFPRRALLVSINNYLMFNTVHYGSGRDSFRGGYPGSSTGVLRDFFQRQPLYFPSSQVFELSDGVPLDSKVGRTNTTQKSVVQAAIQDFVGSSREQDRIVILFAGHGAVLEDKSYLVPIDGSLRKPESLIPLKWVYDQLASCKAQQKILILDVFRFSPGRGAELPTPGEGDEGSMPEAFDKELENPPAGVQVWCSCLKEESSTELEGGSAFLQAMCHALQGGGPEMSGIATPDQPIPIEGLVIKTNQRLTELAAAEKRKQSPRLTGKDAGKAVAFDAKLGVANVISFLSPAAASGKDVAGYALINSMLDELKFPPVRDTRAGDIALLKAQNLPAFPAKILEGFKADGYSNVTELRDRFVKNKEAFAKEYPLRAAYFEAFEALQKSAKIPMREVLSSPIDPKRKAAFLEEQAPAGISIFELEGVLANLKTAEEERDKETSKRWHANFDYIQARLQARLIYLFEYSYTLGQIRADNLPELAPGQSGWRIGTSKKITVTEQKAKALNKATTKLWKRLQDEYPDTPYAILAERESIISLGLQWRPKSD
ncbi:MAG: hypothetical protein EXS16_13570 [Gemmataceae bacterium]|nr:hypothetical protein [Gemmataceae bacterium]